tara:strand:+ start:2189 stop:2713 length:525 start_codon:yes stop_codon:yes gene_type:complete
MQITVIDVGQLTTQTGKNGRSYQILEITYKNEQGQVQSKKLMSFGNPVVFKAAQGWSKGETVDLTTEKDENGYWQWTAIGVDSNSAASAPSSTAPKAATRVTGSNYETSDERAARQVMIVRQSSLSNAVGTLASGGGTAEPADVIAIAKLYEGYVLGAPTSAPNIVDLDSDVPF